MTTFWQRYLPSPFRFGLDKPQALTGIDIYLHLKNKVAFTNAASLRQAIPLFDTIQGLPIDYTTRLLTTDPNFQAANYTFAINNFILHHAALHHKKPFLTASAKFTPGDKMQTFLETLADQTVNVQTTKQKTDAGVKPLPVIISADPDLLQAAQHAHITTITIADGDYQRAALELSGLAQPGKHHTMRRSHSL